MPPPFGSPLRPGSGPPGPGRDSFGIDTNPVPTQIEPIVGRVSGGLTVTITGRNFRNQTNGNPPSVKFDGIPATGVVVVDSHTITALTPATTLSSVVDVTVQINSQIGTLVGAFSYIMASVLAVTPNWGPISGGTEVLIEGVNLQLGSTVFFDNVAASDVIFIDSQHIKAKTPNHSIGFVDVTVVGP